MAKKKVTKAKTATKPKTTAQQLGSLIKSARDIMRKDKGLNGDLDRLPLLTWVMFLKFLDDREKLEEARAGIGGKKYKSAVDAPYRWRDWAANKDGITGDELIAFVNQDEATRPDGTKGPGLLAYLRSLQATADDRRRGVIATVFNGVNNRMLSGYLLRDVINLVDGIHFDSTDEIHTLARLYESMLREMRDAAGDSGEFYTPRPVVQFMVQVTNPTLGEVVLDPACGTGGFLSEAFEHLEKQCITVQQRMTLQEKSIYGGEAKPLPYMLGQMNLLLHGLESPAIQYGNSLATKISEIGNRDRVDVILTNPPFGGEEEKGILSNFPPDKRTTETAVLFMQLILRRLRKPSKTGGGGRAAVVVSDGFLSTRGVCSRVKEEILANFNLQCIVRLPKGVFAPYTPIKTNILFFDHGDQGKDVWYYELPPPEGRQMYTKTKPITSKEFEDCLNWFSQKHESQQAWRVPVELLKSRDYDLDVANPNIALDPSRVAPSLILKSAEETLKELGAAFSHLKKSVQVLSFAVAEAAVDFLGSAINLRKEFITIEDGVEYDLITVKLHGRGLKRRSRIYGSEIRTKKQQVVRTGDLVVAEIDAKMGGYGLVPDELNGAIVSSHYFIYEVDKEKLNPLYLQWFLRSGLPEIWIQRYVKGSTNYASIRQQHFPLLSIPLPDIAVQDDFVQGLCSVSEIEEKMVEKARLLHAEMENLVPSMLYKAFGHAAASNDELKVSTGCNTSE
jgi:type I restriction enzyme M protein